MRPDTEKKGRYVSNLVMAGSFIEETSILKAIALRNFGEGSLVKAVLMGRSPIKAVMKLRYFNKLSQGDKLPRVLQSDTEPHPTSSS